MMKSSPLKRAIKALLLVIVAMSLAWAFWPKPQLVDVVRVGRGNFIISVAGEGKTQIPDIYVLSAPFNGRINRIDSEAGDFVIANQSVIANMHPVNPQFLDKRSEIQAQAAVEGAKAALNLAKARVKQAQVLLDFDLSEYQRTKLLYQKKAVSKHQLDHTKMRLETLRAEVETAQSQQKVMAAQLAAAKVRLLQPDHLKDITVNDCQVCVYSPINGQVLKILHKSETTVNAGTPLVEIGDPKLLEAVIELLSTQAVKVSVGDKAIVTRWGGEENINARVRLIEPSGFTKISALGVEEQRVNVILTLVDPVTKWQNLGNAYRVEASIIVDHVSDALTVPLSALFRYNQQWAVFVIADSQAMLRPVTITRRNELSAEVASGLEDGEYVVIYPSNQLHTGDKVAVKNKKPIR
ncbi:efflux RND transporter periplasmic adaptor subunit [Psychrobium sp. 1_MG-2023]|uniref:efflux RND transporter periplasmic adaptor subunit n=1 Tax=Psychrobium sp. 1_MG-2023 TaxID=3062624 RepID=UPI000C321831|nr:HlyD family efflux transporter periplasmic adaptor subunit [Psychrobium sp. 1_MG-2023]MDP2559764.1 HlyD family efflux transporter periplasmic adaptor subunit [Psychrobium sp. 1_MG-2023]PKF59128.1 hypothetical protein CW748_02765 [Alteromonadales bacterium alter-6D02]